MVFFNYALRKLNAKIVFYGPGLCGKTTNLQWIHDHFEGGQRGRMISLATEGDRTIFFDLLPLDIGTIRGMQVTLQLYTVPGQVHYNSTRQLVLKGADGVVFVADSQRAMLKSNQDSWRNLQENLLLQGVELRGFPHVLQFNKRDLRDIMSVEDLDAFLNQYDAPIFEAVATDGVGVQESLEGIVKLVMRSLKERYEPVVAGGPVPPQPVAGGGHAPTAWPSIHAPGATRPAPPPPAAPPATTFPAGPAFSHPLDVDTDAIGVTTRQLPDIPPVPDEPEPHSDETPTLVSEAETLEEDEVVVPTVVPQIERDGGESDTATGPELFRDSVFGEREEPAQVGTPVDGPTEVSIVDPWSGDGGDEARWPEDDAPDPGASWPEEADEQPFAASGDELEGDAEGPFTAEDESGDVAFLGSAEPQEAPAEPDAWEPVPEGWTAEVPPHLEHGLNETDEIEPDFELVPEEPGPAIEQPSGADPGAFDSALEPEVAELRVGHGHESSSAPGPLPGELFFVSDEEPFGEPFELLRDEPTATREVTAEGSALVAAPSARVSSVDVLPESNQLHVRLHGHGALAEYGQVRELDIMVPVPGQWIGNQRVTLQLRLTLTPSSEDEADGKG